MKLQRIEWRPVAAAAVLACSASSAFAQHPEDRYWAGLEYFYPTVDTTLRFDATATSRPGTTLNLEQDLNLKDREGTPYLDLGMRLGDNWRIQFEYYKLDRTGTNTITRNIDVGDTTFPVGAVVTSTFDSTIYRLTGGWSFVKTQQVEAGIGFGLHVTDFKTQISGVGTGVLPGLGFVAESHNQTVPLPTLGLYGTYMATPQLALRGSVDYLSLNYQDYDGRLMNWMAVVDWRFAKNFGMGAGYRYVDYRVSATKTNFFGQVQYTFKGPTLFVNMAF